MTPMYVHINAGVHTRNDKYINCTNTQIKLKLKTIMVTTCGKVAQHHLGKISKCWTTQTDIDVYTYTCVHTRHFPW